MPALNCCPFPELTLSEQARLEQFAPLFDIGFKRVSPTHYQISVITSDGVVESLLSEKQAHVRLLAELCSKTVRWVHYSRTETVHTTFFSLADSKLLRMAQLYSKWKREGMPR
jgi:hypothetical protein